MHKKITVVYCMMVLLMTGIIYRIYFINNSSYLAMAATNQSQYGNQLPVVRGRIYDRTYESFVNNDYRYIASVIPTPEAANALLPAVKPEAQQALLANLSGGSPFTVEVPTNQIFAQGVDIFHIADRYGEEQLAPHLIGYLNNDSGQGVAGIERAYNQWLEQCASRTKVRYAVNAAGHIMEGGSIQVELENPDGTGGVVLTLHQQVQRFTQKALANGCERGAAVVLDVHSGDILAMASQPVFDQRNISASLEREDAPFVNRGTSGYNIGSVFKVLVSAGAVERGISPWETYHCQGYVDVRGQIFRCNNNAVHGELDMKRALEVSCNTFFIDLSQRVGADFLLSLLSNMGLGKESQLAAGLFAQSGNLPTTQELENPVAFANFSFGQGSSLATPLQMAQAVATIANGGYQVSPRLVLGETQDGKTLLQEPAAYAAPRVLKASTARQLQQLMISVIEDGSGRNAKPVQGGAGGKTSSAQTGQYVGEHEIVHAWFAGFYPAEQPQYAIVVLIEEGESGEHVAAPVFKNIADNLYKLQYRDNQSSQEDRAGDS